MKKPSSNAPESLRKHSSRGFTLMETVIAIGVLAILLTGFLAVFTPAAQGIRRAISSQQADRLTSTLERELITLREDQEPRDATTGFQKAFRWLEEGDKAATAIFVYQYRGDISSLRPDGTPEPLDDVSGQPGIDYTVQSIARRAGDPEFTRDLKAIDGAIFYVKPTQLIYSGNEMVLGTPGQIANPETGDAAASADAYPDAVIAFSAEFYNVPSKSDKYLTGEAFGQRFNNAKSPVFTRNLAVRR